MLKTLFLLLLCFQYSFAQKLTLDERRRRILDIVDEELQETSRLAQQQDNRSPDTLLRMSELNLEKARLWKEVENERYLSISPEERRKTKKADFFKTSAQFYQKANTTAEMVAKRFSNYKDIGDVYYILAFNYKELGKHKDARKYFELSAKKSKTKNQVAAKSRLALADYYFNDHKYKEAIPLYESALSKVDEAWWTKDAFNLAWSHYRLRNYDKAISLMKETHRRSSNEKYIDMRGMVERDIGIFFVDAGKMSDAISFYEGLGMNYTEQFVKIANSIISQGRFAQAESLLAQAAKFEKDRERKIEIMLSELDLFDKYNKVAEHLKVSKELVRLHQESSLGSDQLKKLIYHIDKKAAELQKATASNIYKDVPKAQDQKSQASIAYFELSAILSPDKKTEKVFYQAETAFAAKKFSRALPLYISAFDGAKSEGNKKLLSQTVEGMLSTLGSDNLGKGVADKYYGQVYSRYLSFDSKSERANSIYVKLFNSQFSDKKITEAENTLDQFAEHFPKDYKTQEGMLAKIMEYYRKKKDYAKVKFFISKINDGDYKVSKKYSDALRSLMTKIQIEGVQQSLDKGEKAVALKGYHQIYENFESTPKAKINASYNLSALYYELGDPNQSYKWGTIAVKDMDNEEVNKFADSFLSIASGLFLRQHFGMSGDLSYRILAKLCKQKSANKIIAYKNAVFITLANGDLKKALEIRNFGKDCSIPDAAIAEVSFEILKDLSKNSRFESYEKIINELDANAKNHPALIKPYEDLRLQYVRIGDAAGAQEILKKQNKYYNVAKTQKVEIPVEALDMMAERLITHVKDKKRQLDQIELSFPEETFNNAIKSKLKILDQLTVLVNEVQKTGSGKGIVEAYEVAISSYENFGESIRDFTPPGKGPEYIASFKKAMSDVFNPILTNAAKQRGEIRKLIYDNKILSQTNFFVLLPRMDSFKRYITKQDSVLMERGGKR